MTKRFEIGIYCHTLKGIDLKGIDHVTLLGSELLADFQKEHPRITLAVALDKKGLKSPEQWKEVTVMAHKGMALEKECVALIDQGHKVRVALPSDLEFLKSFEVGPLGSLDLKIDLMAFDYAHPKPGCRTNFHTLLFAWEGPSVHQTLRFLHDHGIPSHKIRLGLASFGVMFKNVPPGLSNTGYGQPCGEDQLGKFEVDPEEYLRSHPDAKIFYTSFQGCFQSFIYHAESGDWISFDDFITHQSKIEWARHRGLKGVFFYQ